MTDSLKSVRSRNVPTTATPQSKKAVKGQKKNNAGGFTFVISDTDRLKRFLILGSEANHYVSGQKMSKDNAKVVIKAASDEATSRELVDLIVEISTEGRAPKPNAAIFALAVAASHGTVESKAYALAQLPAVLRTGTHMFLFAGYIEQFRGWGPALRRAVASWYTSKDVDKLAYQAAKYQSREGWKHRDLFRLSHPKSNDPLFWGLGEWILRGDSSEAPRVVKGFVAAHETGADVPALVREYGLSWEMLPTESLNEVKVWEALLDGNLPLGALLRQLPRLTRLGVVGKAGAGKTAEIVARLTDEKEIESARIHPIAALTAHKVYAAGKSEKGSGIWSPVPDVVNALDEMFYKAFKNVTPSGKRTLIGLDVSGSMDGAWGRNEVSILTPREATAAISLVIEATEPSTHVIGFTGGARGYSGYRSESRVTSAGSGRSGMMVTDLDSVVNHRRRLDDVMKDLRRMPMGSTDCALPMLYALEEGLEIDTFVILTDNETWAGQVHPFQALKQYREKTGIPAKLVVLATEATPFSIADPSDAGMLDIAGFDSAAPSILADFSRGF
jgi:60 kDa SS-A/Ro ribonucleoprotein